MNILYIGGFKLPDKNAAAHRVLSNAKILRDLGSKVYLVGQTDDLDVNSEFLVPEDSGEENIHMFSSPYPKGMVNWFKYITDISQIKKCVKKYNIDCIILYNYPSYSTYRLLPFLRKNDIKIYADCTEWYGKSSGNFIKKIVKDFDTWFRMERINFRLDGVICISTYLENYYKNTNTILVPPLVDVEENKWEEVNNVSQENNQPITFVYAGQLGGEKDRLVKVIEILLELKNKHNYHFIFKIIGMTKSTYLKYYDLKELDNSIKFYGRLSHIETLKEVKKSDFVLFFREKNRINMAGFPTKFVEAITCGIPVVTNNTSDLKFYIEEDVNGYFLGDTTENVSEKFELILNLDKNKLSDLKSNILKKNPFDYKLYYKDFENILQ